MPSKALLRPYEALAEARRLPGAAQAVTGTFDVAAVLARRDEVIHSLDDSSQLPWLEDRGIELFRGQGRLAGERRGEGRGDDGGTGGGEAGRAGVLAGGAPPRQTPLRGFGAAARGLAP